MAKMSYDKLVASKRQARARGGLVGDKKRDEYAGETNTVGVYLNALRNFPQLPHEEVVILFQKYNEGVTRGGGEEGKDAVAWTPVALRARKKLAECNLRLVVSIAKQYKRSDIPIEDLIQEGNLGLLKAIDRFDWARGYKFSTYATWWIKQAIGQHVLKRKRIIRLPAHAATVQRKLMQAAEEYRDTNGSEPTTEELTAIIGASETVVKATIHSGRGTISLQQPLSSSGEGDTIEDKVEDEGPGANPHENVAEKELLEITRAVIQSLSPKEAAILRLRFGLVEDDTNSADYPITEAEMRQVMAGTGLK